MKQKKPLYRKANSKARGCTHWTGPDAKWDRGTKEGIQRKMIQGTRRGRDYTPLFKFLLSKVGCKWDEVHKECVARLDGGDEHIWSMVDDGNHSHYTYGYFRRTNAWYSTLFVNENGILQLVNPNLKNEDFEPGCPCCTYTFNGKPLNRKFNFDKK